MYFFQLTHLSLIIYNLSVSANQKLSFQNAWDVLFLLAKSSTHASK